MATHQDSFADETRHSNQERVSDFPTFNPTATDEIEISTDDMGRDELEFEKPLLVALARENFIGIDGDEYNDTGCIDTTFDEALCDVAELALRTAGFDTSAYDLRKLRALMIRVARGLNSFGDLATHIERYSVDQIHQFGLYSYYSKSTYTKAAKELKKAERFEVLKEATFIAVHELFSNGVPIPDTVLERYNLAYDLGPAASNFSPAARQVALYALVDELLEIVIDKLDLQRSSNKSRDIRSLLGIFAHAAYGGESIRNYEQTAQHSVNIEQAFAGSTIPKHIDELELWEIEEMFDEINQALLKYVIESGVVSKPVTISYDLTDKQSLGRETFDNSYLTADGRWRFASLSFTDPDLEFAFGLRMLKSESQRASVLKNFLRNLVSMVDVQLFMADRGFDGIKDIETCRAFVPEHWVICAQDYSDTRSPGDDYRRLREKLEPGGTAVVRNAGYEELHPPVQLIGYSGATDTSDSIDPVRAFYTDIPIPNDKNDRDSLITDINWTYNQRGKIETLFRLAKNNFDVSTDSDKAARKAFYFHMSVLFYNLYNIVKTVPSPKRGLEIETTQNELLEVTRISAFNGINRPDAQTYFLERP